MGVGNSQFLPSKWATADPGETTGYAIFESNRLVAAGQAELWTFVRAVAVGLFQVRMPGLQRDPELLNRLDGIDLLVMEDWFLYPDKAQKLIGDKQDTVRGIGALQLACEAQGIAYEFQATSQAKDGAVQAGARDFFRRPLHENRHANDAIMHGVYKVAMQGKGVVEEV